MKRPARILVVNDDGINAPGLDALAAVAAEIGDEVWVVAPEIDQSGVSHSVSLNDPLRLRRIGERRFAVHGTPTDCVIMGARHLMKEAPPDLVLSGFNGGQNAAEDVIYSGTVAGAVEGAVLGMPAIALSQSIRRDTPTETIFACAAERGAEVIWKILETGIAPGALVNVNFPACAPGEVEGTAVTRQGRRPQDFVGIEPRRDGRNRPYYWVTYGPRYAEAEEGTDLWALQRRMISITPLRVDLTDHGRLASLAEAMAAPAR
ncbi:MAG TPA: 5'/3'-nucleotidase SurE [Hyphomicrobiales bacterium]|nr:5'/3'-nucleotidase SurE [Hyphomicrobiales bacterium]